MHAGSFLYIKGVHTYTHICFPYSSNVKVFLIFILPRSQNEIEVLSKASSPTEERGWIRNDCAASGAYYMGRRHVTSVGNEMLEHVYFIRPYLKHRIML